ncbi:MAG TPA: PilZ domain-containing protein [Candidatus Acidoferrales bacterium]|jgi:hypothetical protein|nr:PilZ domain-containing protein [Candidatus Acidoferrales bacterium]
MSIRCSSFAFDGILVELRKSRRYRPLAPASFSWEGPSGLLREAKGAIRDISDRGVFVAGGTVPPVGAHIDVDVRLPSPEARGGGVELHGEGTVVRVDRDAEGIRGFAAEVTFRAEASRELGGHGRGVN